MASSLFRAPTDMSLSDSDSSGDREVCHSGDGDGHEAEPVATPSAPAAESQHDEEEVNPGTLNKEPDYGAIPELDAEGHNAVMTSALLEFYCTTRACDILNDQTGSQNRYKRDSPEAKLLGRQLYTYKSRFLSSHGVLTDGIEGDDWDNSRQYYRDSLDVLGSAALERLELDSTLPVSTHGPMGALADQGQPGIQGEQAQRPRVGLQRRITDRPDAPPATGKENSPPTFMELVQRPEYMSPQETTLSALAPQSYAQQLGLSRYSAEFEEQAIIGKGAYGAVYRVKHHVDGQVYAVKKIPLSARRLKDLQDGGLKELDNILKEIRTLARLEHRNVVRYYGAWAEYASQSMPHMSTDIPTAVTQMAGPGRPQGLLSANEEDLSFNVVFEDSGPSVVFEESSHDIVFEESSKSVSARTHKSTARGERSPKSPTGAEKSLEDSEEEDDYDDDKKDGDEEEDVESISRRFPLPDGITSTGPDEDIFTDDMGSKNNQLGCHSSVTSNVPAITLHIQMSLHPFNLGQYLHPQSDGSETIQNRHCFHLVPSIQIILGVLSGVEYLHAKGIIHRDLKPANIFLSTSDGDDSEYASKCPVCEESGQGRTCPTIPRIGDFGLVADRSPYGEADDDTEPPVANRPVGTEFYRPPAIATKDNPAQTPSCQDKGKEPEAKTEAQSETNRTLNLDESLDVFALGVILFELLYKLDTRMERQMVLSELTCPHNRSIQPKLPADFADKFDASVVGLRCPEQDVDVPQQIGQCILGMVAPDAAKRWGCKRVRRCLESVHSVLKTQTRDGCDV